MRDRAHQSAIYLVVKLRLVSLFHVLKDVARVDDFVHLDTTIASMWPVGHALANVVLAVYPNPSEPVIVQTLFQNLAELANCQKGISSPSSSATSCSSSLGELSLLSKNVTWDAATS